MKIKVSAIVLVFLSVSTYAQNKWTPELLWQVARIGEEQVSPDGKLLLYGVSNYQLAENQSSRAFYIRSVEGGAARKLVEMDRAVFNPRWRPDGEKIGFLSTQSGSTQLWEINPDGTGLAQTTDYEFGIENFAYAPDMAHISFTADVKLDETVRDLYPDLPYAEARIIDDLMYRHWDEWHDYMYSHVFFDTYTGGKVGGAPKDIMKSECYDVPLKPFGGSEDLVWSPDGNAILYVCKKQSGKEYALGTDSDLYLYDLVSGETSNLTEGLDGYDRNPSFAPDGTKIAWLNMARAGFESDKNTIYLYDIASGRKKSLTGESELSPTTLVWGAKNREIYFIAGDSATYQVFHIDLKTDRFDRVNPKPSDIRQVTEGRHDYNSLSLAGRYLVGGKTSMSTPLSVFRIDPRSGTETELTLENREFLSKISTGKVEKRMIKTSDGKEMLTWVIYPPGFDPSKKYPTLLYCQGGPQSAVSQFFSYRWNFQLMAANGYIVVAPNRRGLPSFGSEWNDQISGDWGGQAMKDYLAAIDSVAKEPFVDVDRLGAVGASYGGYSIYYLAGIHERRFKTFISHCGLFNLESWYASTEEMFFANWDVGGPYWIEPKPESYEKFSPHRFVGNWDTPILVIHGEKDFRVPINQGIEAFNAAQLQDIPSRFLYFPNEGHWVLQPQNSVLWHRVFFDWLDRYLK